MKTTLSTLVLGGVMTLALAACTSTPMNSDTATGSSATGTTTSSEMAPGSNENASRGAAPVNCTVTGTDTTNTAATTPGTKCPTNSQ